MFWKAMNWLGDNWKSIALLGIPVLISFIAGLMRKNKSLENKVEMKEREVELTKESAELEANKREEARIQKEKLIAAAERTHDQLIHQVKEDMAARIAEIETAEQATAAIKEVVEEPAWMKLTAADIKPPKFPNPAMTSRNRLCPCGSGKKYRYCHAKQWTEK